ncbi:ATP-binding cassette domain-containing protein [Rhizobium sp. KVB221]|uniref:ATP-binding cassette domain-containing protein n=1 Tax=Rhizobium setariae TaxID=2801340 RepID=A0A936YND9_9HYPH|nr:ABC transporter transmembrane domain-containing protein [Rhizobium setariae]MBL0373648.1 ATP-binding cassette domain-containing protein [Rhizobium setariae]
MENSLLQYIWRHTRKQQLWILLVVAVSMIPYFLSFDLPKQIVNGPIQGKGFESEGATQIFMRIAFDLPGLGNVVLFPGVELGRMAMLFALSMVFLLLVIINGLFKFYINTYKGRLGERLLRRIRFELVDRILRFPPNQFKRAKGAEVASMVKDEVEPLGGFTGDAFVSPALLGGQALTALIFIIAQNMWLGLIAAAMVGIQGFIIPRMRRRLLVLGRERQLTARELSGRVSEIFDGIGTIRAYDTSNYERADIANRLGQIFKIRYDLYQWKFLVKFINNFLASVTPFLFYAFGGYLALKGQLDIGQLVAVIAAYKDLPGPLKELIDWDQMRQDVQVKYVQVVEQFSVDGMLEEEIHSLATEPAKLHDASLATVNLSLTDDSGARLLSAVSMQVNPGETVAIVGTAASGGEALAEAFARIIWPDTGKIVLGGSDMRSLPESVTGRHLSYASSDTYLFQGSLRDNLLYGLKHAPLTEYAYDEAGEKHRKWAVAEARLAGNPDYDVNSDWIDYAAAGATGPESISVAIAEALDAVLLAKDILDLAMRSIVNPAEHQDLVERIVEIRHALRTELDEENLSSLVVSFEPGAYNTEATVGENLLFGTATGPQLMGRAIGSNQYFLSVMRRTGLDRILYEMGLEIAENAVNLFGDLPPDHPFFQQLTFMTADDLPQYQLLLQKLKGKRLEDVAPDDLVSIIRLSFLYIEPRHRFGLLTDELMAKIVAVRQEFHEGLPADLSDAIERYDPERYMTAATLLDNVLLGKISHKHPDGSERIRSIIRKLLFSLGLYESVLSIGLEFNVGAGGRRLTSVQRQKLNLARAIIRRSALYVFNRPLASLDLRIQDQILRNVLELLRKNVDAPTILWVLSNSSMSELFDRVVVFDKGKLVEDGTHAALIESNGIFRELVS